MCACESINAWARAASAAGKTSWMTGLTLPPSSHGQTVRFSAAAIALLNATGRGRSVEPVMT